MRAVEMTGIRWIFGPSGSWRPIREDLVATMMRKYLSEPYEPKATCPLRY